MTLVSRSSSVFRDLFREELIALAQFEKQLHVGQGGVAQEDFSSRHEPAWQLPEKPTQQMAVFIKGDVIDRVSVGPALPERVIPEDAVVGRIPRRRGRKIVQKVALRPGHVQPIRLGVGSGVDDRIRIDVGAKDA